MWAIAVAVAVFVLPNVEALTADGQPIGLPVRGYGVMVLLGLLCGVGITSRRGKQVGIHPDTIIGLGFWMMLGGVLGARVFFVVQKWEELAGDSFAAKLVDAVKVTEGGLVIYGGVIGGLVAGWIYCQRHRLPILATADLVAPGFLIGLSLGRIGCLLHGCCFGGICQAGLPTITFPHGSVPYQAQVMDGSLLGLQLNDRRLPSQVKSISPGSVAEQRAIQPGMVVTGIFSSQLADKPANPVLPPRIVAEVDTQDKQFLFMPNDLPAQSLAVHPSQIYASINALLLTILIWFLQPLTKQDGVVFCAAILLYAVTRCLLEWVRSDEAGQFGTGLTIAQLVAVASALLAIIGLAVLKRADKPRIWQTHWDAIAAQPAQTT